MFTLSHRNLVRVPKILNGHFFTTVYGWGFTRRAAVPVGGNRCDHEVLDARGFPMVWDGLQSMWYANAEIGILAIA